MPRLVLTDRAVIEVQGPEARDFLDRLVTCAIDRIEPAGARYGALLTPQGKIIADFICFDAGGGEEPRYLLDVPAGVAADLAKRLALYKLRAKVQVRAAGEALHVVAGWGDAALPGGTGVLAAAPDPRLPALGWRAILEPGVGLPGDADRSGYERHRVSLGVPNGGQDFAYADAFPHEALMDQLGGVDFDKGCYVGQEVVSRMQHRGTARTRIVPYENLDGHSLPPGTEITAGERVVGRTGSSVDGQGLATIRLDRAADALAAGDPILASGSPVRFLKPDWIRFPVPGESLAPAA